MMIKISTLLTAAITAALLGMPALAQAPSGQSSHGKSAAGKATPVAPAPIQPVLRSDVTIGGDLVTFGDLIAGLAPAQAATPAFRAPALGETGTIQAARIIEAAKLHNMPEITTGTIGQTIVTRAARRVGSGEIEQAVKLAVESRHGVDGRALALVFDAGAPSLAVEPDLTQPLSVQDLSYDQRLRRVSATLVLPGSATTRLRPLRISGQLVETIEVVMPTRPLTKGETLASADVSLERRPREGLGSDTIADLQAAIGKVVKRPMMPGQPLRAADVQRNEVIGRGDLVNMTFEAPGIVVSMRGRASEAGGIGDVINIQNLQSKRVLQATVTGPGRVSVSPGSAQRLASAD
ncbi:MAG: flagellar basal body P-ring formation chaperone FlgA [Bosea sp. (in: a-proteobacteria)]